MEEVWKEIDGFPDYKVSTLGNVMSKKSGEYRLLNPSPDKKNYLLVSLQKNKKRFTRKVHRLVAIAFLPNYYGLPQVDHKDRNKQNNSLYNLRWVSQKENMRNRDDYRDDITETDKKKRQQILSKQSHQIRIDEKRFYCNLCNLSYHNNYGLQRHLNSTSHLRIFNFKPTTKHFCRVCGVSCISKYLFERHNKSKRHITRMENVTNSSF